MIARDRIRIARYRRALVRARPAPAEVVEAAPPPEAGDVATGLVSRLVARHAPDAAEALGRLLDDRRPS